MSRTVVLVEGESDRVALLTLAGRLGVDLDGAGATVMAMGGITNLRRWLVAHDDGVRLVAMHDAGETPYVDRVVRDHTGVPPALFVCDADLEDELIRALGVGPTLDVVAAAGDLEAWRTLLNQPFHRGRPEEQVLRRFFGTTSGRKQRYAELLVSALDLDRVPSPLAAALATAVG